MTTQPPHWTRQCVREIERTGQVALVTQCVVEGSAPREAGAKMVVSDTRIWGTIGGGNLEFQAIDQARKLLSAPTPEPPKTGPIPANFVQASLLQDYPLGPLLAQCCGGHVRLLIERLTTADLTWLVACMPDHGPAETVWTKANILAEDGEPRRTVVMPNHTALAQNQIGYFTNPDGTRLNGSRPPLADCAAWLERHEEQIRELYVIGAGHVGRALAHTLALAPFALRWWDNRSPETLDLPAQLTAGFTPPLEPFANPDDLVAQASAGTMFLVLTHDHELDYQLVRAILARKDAAFCGLIGSKTKRARFVRRLRDDGFTQTHIDQLTCPIGVGPLASKTPAAIALSTATQVMALLETDTP